MSADREQTLDALRNYRERLLRRREELTARRDAELARAEQLQADADRRLQEYRATPQGIAESLRALETAALSGTPRPRLRGLQRAHLAAEQASAEEYAARRDRWGHKPGDGPVRGCPAGPDGALRTQIMRERIFGSYRHDPDTQAVRIGLFRLTETGRLRTAVTMPLDGRLGDRSDSIDLCTVLTWALSNGAVSDRILHRLDLDSTRWLPLATAHIAAPAMLAD